MTYAMFPKRVGNGLFVRVGAELKLPTIMGNIAMT